MRNSIITHTGSFIPALTIPNKQFLNHEFYGADGIRFEKENPEIIDRLRDITGINQRRYATDDLNTSDIAFLAAQQALDELRQRYPDAVSESQIQTNSTAPAAGS